MSRLDGVRRTGDQRWLAKCPAHDDRSPSLSIREVDGTILLHDFGGCDPGQVIAAVGLTFADLFPEPIDGRKALSRWKRRVPARDALAAIDREALIVAVVAADMLGEKTIDEPTWARLAEASRRIGAARAATE